MYRSDNWSGINLITADYMAKQMNMNMSSALFLPPGPKNDMTGEKLY